MRPPLDLCKVTVYTTLTSVDVAQWLIISPQEIVDDAAMQSTSEAPDQLQFSPPAAGDH